MGRVNNRSFLILITLALALAACSTEATRERIARRAAERGSCFERCPEGEVAPPAGLADLTVYISVKVLKTDPCLIKTVPSRSSGASYPIVININGQGEQWLLPCAEDIQKRVVAGKRNPEGGEGLKCTLQERLRMKAGTYRVYVGLPEEGVEKQVDLALESGATYELDFNPFYFRDRLRGRNFMSGIVGFNVYLNGKPVGRLRR